MPKQRFIPSSEIVGHPNEIKGVYPAQRTSRNRGYITDGKDGKSYPDSDLESPHGKLSVRNVSGEGGTPTLNHFLKSVKANMKFYNPMLGTYRGR